MDIADLLRQSLPAIDRLRASGPATDEFLRWRDRMLEMLGDLLGPEHEAVAAFRNAVGPFDAADSLGLQVHGQYGIAPRLERGEAVLRSLRGAAR